MNKPQPSEGNWRNSFVVLGVVAAGVIAVLAILLASTPEPAQVSPVSDALPTGAGSLPDGVADEKREGLRNDTTTDTFIDNSNPTNIRSPLLEEQDTAPSPEPGIDGLERVPNRSEISD